MIAKLSRRRLPLIVVAIALAAPRALAQTTPRVVVAAFNTGKDLPTGKTRVARLMVRVSPETALPKQLEGHLTAAATPDAKPIAGATLQIVEGAMK